MEEEVTLEEFLSPPWHHHEVDDNVFEIIDAIGEGRGLFFDEQMVDYIVGLVNVAHGYRHCCGEDH